MSGFGGAGLGAGTDPASGGIMGWVTSRTPSPATALSSPIVKYGLYALFIIIAVGVILVTADFIWPFLPFSPTNSGPSAAARAGKTFWRISNDNEAQENLIVPAAESPVTIPDVYTLSVQVMIGDSRSPSLGMFRHILHRGSNPCGLTAPPTAGGTGQANIRLSDLPPGTEPSYMTMGLPQIMNPGLFLDAYKNDIHVFIHTVGTENGERVLWLESATISDLPLHKALNIGVVCNGKTVELYVGCRLYSTLLLRGSPHMPKSENNWYGRYCAFPLSGIVKNLQLWGTSLTSGDYMKMCRSPDIDAGGLPSTCPTAGAAPQPASAPATTTS